MRKTCVRSPRPSPIGLLPVSDWQDQSIELVRILCRRVGVLNSELLSELEQDEFFRNKLGTTVSRLKQAGLLDEVRFMAKSLGHQCPRFTSMTAQVPNVDRCDLPTEAMQLLKLRNSYMASRRACNLFGGQYQFPLSFEHLQREFTLSEIFVHCVRRFGYSTFHWQRDVKISEHGLIAPDAILNFRTEARPRLIYLMRGFDARRLDRILQQYAFNGFDYEIW